MTSDIPIIDLSPLMALTSDPVTWSPDDDVIRALSDDIIKAFTDIGFVYVINHGISQEMVDRMNAVNDTFFSLPPETKANYARDFAATGSSNGWIGIGKERLDPTKLGGYREAYNMIPCNAEMWPNDEVPGFQAEFEAMERIFRKLASKVLMMIGIGLRLEEPDFFVQRHNADKPSYTTLRSLYYPPIPEDMEVGPQTVRCGEHGDMSTISLLFQDDAGGLEVKTREGHFIPATPIEGSVLINVGDTMQRWTADRLVSTRHRVPVPDNEAGRGQTRRSFGYFAHADHDVIIRCIDNSNKYPPILSKTYTAQKIISADK